MRNAWRKVSLSEVEGAQKVHQKRRDGGGGHCFGGK